LPTASKKPAGGQEQHQQECQVRELGDEAAAEAREGLDHQAQETGGQGPRDGEAGEHELQPEIDEHGCGQATQDPHDGSERAPDALRPQDLEGLELDRVDPLLVAPAEARLQLPERPHQAEQSPAESGGGRNRLAGPA
jgi:hypothetical protein